MQDILEVFLILTLYKFLQLIKNNLKGKSRQELKEILKTTKPMKEYLHRVKSNVSNGQLVLEAGNADYVGKSTSVYRKISSEAKDSYQSLLQLRNYFIQKSLSELNLNHTNLSRIDQINILGNIYV
jgi:hypothetical protein